MAYAAASREAKRLGLVPCDVGAGGDCFAYALSDQLGHPPGMRSADLIRTALVDYMRNNSQELQPFWTHEVLADLPQDQRSSIQEFIDNGDWRGYCRWMGRPGNYIGDLEIQAAAEAFSVDIVIVADRYTRLVEPTNTAAGTRRAVFIMYDSDSRHYLSLRLTADAGSGPASVPAYFARPHDHDRSEAARDWLRRLDDVGATAEWRAAVQATSPPQNRSELRTRRRTSSSSSSFDESDAGSEKRRSQGRVGGSGTAAPGHEGTSIWHRHEWQDRVDYDGTRATSYSGSGGTTGYSGDTPVLRADGSVVLLRNVRAGDRLRSSDGQGVNTVLAVSTGVAKVIELSFRSRLDRIICAPETLIPVASQTWTTRGGRVKGMRFEGQSGAGIVDEAKHRVESIFGRELPGRRTPPGM